MSIREIFIALSLVCSLSSACVRSYYIAKRPEEPKEERPAAPYADAVWIPGDWEWNGHEYAYSGGHYEHAQKGRVYVKGGWAKGGSGYYWRKGHWR